MLLLRHRGIIRKPHVLVGEQLILIVDHARLPPAALRILVEFRWAGRGASETASELLSQLRRQDRALEQALSEHLAKLLTFANRSFERLERSSQCLVGHED